MLERLWKGLKPEAAAMDRVVVMSLPPVLREAILGQAPDLVETRLAFERLFRSAERTLKIFAPYVDPTLTGLIQGVNAKILIVTTVPTGGRVRSNPVLERCSTMRDLTVRYLNVQQDRALLYQMHAKLILADDARAYVGSANLTDTSIHYNLELGLLTENPAIVATLTKVFDHVFQQVAVPAKLL